jgi:hypothetical protein
MNKILKTMSFIFSAMVTLFSPIQDLTQAGGICCAECYMKREDEIETIAEVEDISDIEL